MSYNEIMKHLGFFEEEKKETQKVEIEVDAQRYLLFKGALSVLNQDETQAFNDFISYTLTRANRVLNIKETDYFDLEYNKGNNTLASIQTGNSSEAKLWLQKYNFTYEKGFALVMPNGSSKVYYMPEKDVFNFLNGDSR